MSRLNNNIGKNSPDNAAQATQNFVERDDRECKKLVKAFRDWLLAFDDLRLTVEDLTFHSWSPEKPLAPGRGA